MAKVGLFEAKQRLSELVERAAKGERVGITRRGKLLAYIVPARTDVDVQAIFDNIEELRKRVRPKKGITTRQMMEEGRT